MEYITNSPSETEAVGAALARVLQPGTVIAYRGDLGGPYRGQGWLCRHE